MNKNRIVSAALAGLAGLAFAGAAQAAITPAGSVGGAPTSGVFRENFDAGTVGLLNGLTVTLAGGAAAVTGASSGVYAPPFLSGGNGGGFGPGGTDQADGADATMYLTTGTGSVTLDFASDQQYFGVLWGSIDGYNTITFYNDGGLVQAFTGTDILAGANGDQGVNGTLYVNFTTNDTPFDRVVFTSSSNAFEFDNVAFGERVPVPTPEPVTLTLFGAGLAGLGLMRRRRKA